MVYNQILHFYICTKAADSALKIINVVIIITVLFTRKMKL